ncbi:DUF4192 family protein [Corynebacterium macclintockiae]|uniref:DUF4192 family protein n=1 Tax=Corynebacterium macclintockiae TaxID=2913501 RepID=UPI00254B0E00|nr:DUF4192 family protein [Corynebacterium macclintockiae]MDK8890477.1 DUF4192 family protein [Corynebacterium macclintockiae]
MNNSPEDNQRSTQSIPTPSVHLGADKGKLIAAIPSLLGFPPVDSMVLIGLVASGDTDSLAEGHRRFRIGPVLRCDLHPVAVDEAVRGLSRILCDAPAAEAIILAIGNNDDCLGTCMATATNQLQRDCVELQSALIVRRIATGEEWTDLLDGEKGTVDSVETNELADISALSGARKMRGREEMEQWLDPANLLEPDWIIEDRGEASTVDLIQVLISVASVANGTRVLEEECEHEYLVDSLAAVCSDELLHTLVIAWSLGANSAILREMLASTARRTTGAVRRRVMLILALVASANDEGVLAYHTLNRLLEELQADLRAEDACHMLDNLGQAPWIDDEETDSLADAPEDVLQRVENEASFDGELQLSDMDSFTVDIAIAALDAHQRGMIKLLLAKAVRAACTVMANVQMDLDAAEDGSEEASENEAPEGEHSYVTVREYAGLDIAWEYERLLQTVDWDAINAVRNATYHPVVR